MIRSSAPIPCLACVHQHDLQLFTGPIPLYLIWRSAIKVIWETLSYLVSCSFAKWMPEFAGSALARRWHLPRARTGGCRCYLSLFNPPLLPLPLPLPFHLPLHIPLLFLFTFIIRHPPTPWRASQSNIDAKLAGSGNPLTHFPRTNRDSFSSR